MERRIRAAIARYVANHDAKPWTGPVVRLEDLTDAERIAIGGRARADCPPSQHHTWRCAGCRQWTMRGAYLVGRCNFCGVVRP